MNKPFKATVNKTYEFTSDKQQLKNLDIVEQSEKSYHLLKDNKPYQATIINTDFNQKEYTVLVNGNTYQVKISNELDMLIDELGLEIVSEIKENNMKAPMPGLIVSIDVAVGQEVKEGEGVLVLEAMKMENTLQAPKDGIIKSILIQSGDKVEKGMVLIEME